MIILVECWITLEVSGPHPLFQVEDTVKPIKFWLNNNSFNCVKVKFIFFIARPISRDFVAVIWYLTEWKKGGKLNRPCSKEPKIPVTGKQLDKEISVD